MLRLFSVLFLQVVLCLNCFSQVLAGKKTDEIPGLIMSDSAISLLITPSQFSEVKIGSINSVFYEILVDKDNRIEYISTGDTLFKTKEGVRVGDKYILLRKKRFIKRGKEILYRGWGYVLKLKSGWFAVFDFATPIHDDSPILFFYQKSY